MIGGDALVYSGYISRSFGSLVSSLARVSSILSNTAFGERTQR